MLNLSKQFGVLRSCCRQRFNNNFAHLIRNLSSVLHVGKSEDNKIITISLNNNATKNALTRDVMTKLNNLLIDLGSEDSQARVIIIRSSVPKVFCSGHHLKEVSTATKCELESLFSLCSEMMWRIKTMPQAVIAQVDGLATAAGCQLVASCDLAIASEISTFATPGVNLGLFCSTPAVALVRTVAHKHALELLLTGDPVDADHAHRIGLINRVVPRNELEQEIDALSAKIASKSGSAIRIGKANYWRQVEAADEVSAYAISTATMVENMLHINAVTCVSDAREGIRAFLEKRKPNFR